MSVQNCFGDAVNAVNSSGQKSMIKIRGYYDCGDIALYLMQNNLMPDSAIVVRDIFKVFADRSEGIALKKYCNGGGITHMFPVLFSITSVEVGEGGQYRDAFYEFAKWCKDIGINVIYTADSMVTENGRIWINYNRKSGICKREDKLYIADLKFAKEDPRLTSMLDFVHII